jgi:endonuclease YncB( thermonuclease family)
MRGALALSLVMLGSLVLFACDDTLLKPPPVAPDPNGDFDGSALDAGSDALVPSGCPEPVPITPANMQGFRATELVTLAYTTDGDTATFKRSGGTEVTVRFLFVNTEESFGNETTAWGKVVKDIVGNYLKSARQLNIAIRLKNGSDDLDPFGRSLGLVFLDGELFQSRIVREGLSPYYTAFGCANVPVHTNLLHSEAEARANQRGVWKPGHPTDYRVVMKDWIGNDRCRINPYERAYCP